MENYLDTLYSFVEFGDKGGELYEAVNSLIKDLLNKTEFVPITAIEEDFLLLIKKLDYAYIRKEKDRLILIKGNGTPVPMPDNNLFAGLKEDKEYDISEILRTRIPYPFGENYLKRRK